MARKLSNDQDILELSSKKAQIIAYLYDCDGNNKDFFYDQLSRIYPHADMSAEVDIIPGTIKLAGKKEQRKVVAIFGRAVLNGDLDQHLGYFRAALKRISKIKNLKSIAFPYKLGSECSISDEDWIQYKKLINGFANKHKDIRVFYSERNNRQIYNEENTTLESRNQKLSESLAKALEALDDLGINTVICDECNEWVFAEDNDDEIVNNICKKCLYPHQDHESVEDKSDNESENADENEDNDENIDNTTNDSDEEHIPESYKDTTPSTARSISTNDEYITDDVNTNVINNITTNDNTKEWSHKTNSLTEFINEYLLKQFEDEGKKPGWRDFFAGVLKNQLLDDVLSKITKDAKITNVYPPLEDVFAVFELTALEEIKVLILGQDPYHTPGAAMGLAFSHRPDRHKAQPSLENIHKELVSDGFHVDMTSPDRVDLTSWALQGVFLLNTALTVKEADAGSHKKEWNYFTTHLLRYIAKNCKNIVVILWGTPAKDIAMPIFKDTKHKILSSVHPSPMSAYSGFFGSKPFSKANKQLELWGIEPIDWSLGEESD